MGSDNDQVSDKHLLLKPEEAGFLDFVRILFSGEIESKKFIECLEVKEAILERRGLIFASMLAQKSLQFFSKPLSWFGFYLELWLNILHSSNSNLTLLLVNLLQRTVVLPDMESGTFMSLVGMLDRREELDRSIEPGDGRYLVSLSAMASKIAYENKAFIQTTVDNIWKMELLGAYDFWNEFQMKKTTQGFMLHDNRNSTSNPDDARIVVAFRGSELFDADAWCTDFDVSWCEFQNMGQVHGGFMKALGLQNDRNWPPEVKQDGDRPLAYYFIREKLRQIFQRNRSSRTKFLLTGHSQGGALAILFAAVLALHNEEFILERLEAVYTFGQPRVGNEKFGEFMKENLRKYGIKYYRFVYSHDMVPRLPFDNSSLMFKHFGTCLYFNTLYQGKIVSEEPDRNYFSMRSLITKRVDAVWELVRSFIIPRTNGAEFSESWLLRAVRILGLIMPGLPAHCLQDYVNVTRLGEYCLMSS